MIELKDLKKLEPSVRWAAFRDAQDIVTKELFTKIELGDPMTTDPSLVYDFISTRLEEVYEKIDRAHLIDALANQHAMTIMKTLARKALQQMLEATKSDA